MAPIVCTRCRRLIRDPYQQFAERLEYRRLDTIERRHTWTVRLLCRDCVDQLADEHKGRADRGDQMGLF